MFKIDLNKVDNKSENTFCQACLSSDRNLSSIGDYLDIFKNISSVSYHVSQSMYLCWECMAVLKKIKHFRAKIEKAQRILTYHIINKQKSFLQSLSNLRKTYTDTVINISYSEEDDDFKQKAEIKQENDNSNDDYNYDHSDKDSCLEEIKKENIIDTKCIKKNKALHYRIVFEFGSKKVLRKKVSIKEDNFKIWMEKEKNCEFYKNFKYRCKMCVHGFNVKERLKEHVLKHHDKSIGSYLCQICKFRFSTEPALCAHMQGHNIAWECTRCGFQCYTARRLNAHLRTHSMVQCVYCDAKFLDLSSFYSHYKSLHSIFLCDHCGKRCKTKYMLEKHMRRHLDTHTCPTCFRHYKSMAALRKHTTLKHLASKSEDAYCVLCDRQYDSAPVYRRHVQNSKAHAHETQTQTGKKFPCPECSNTYSRRAYMMNHFRHVHMNQSKHYCSECDRHFLNRTRYVDHMRYNHEGVKKEKNKLCNICGRGFAANRTLMNHIRTHSGERPYECEYCSAKFTQRTSMVSHVKFIHLKSGRRGCHTVQ